jgi:hypothetical protein
VIDRSRIRDKIAFLKQYLNSLLQRSDLYWTALPMT